MCVCVRVHACVFVLARKGPPACIHAPPPRRAPRQLSLGKWALTTRLLAPIVEPIADVYARFMLSRRRKVDVKMVTISGLMEEMDLRCAARGRALLCVCVCCVCARVFVCLCVAPGRACWR